MLLAQNCRQNEKNEGWVWSTSSQCSFFFLGWNCHLITIFRNPAGISFFLYFSFTIKVCSRYDLSHQIYTKVWMIKLSHVKRLRGVCLKPRVICSKNIFLILECAKCEKKRVEAWELGVEAPFVSGDRLSLCLLNHTMWALSIYTHKCPGL